MQTSYSNAPLRARVGLIADNRTFKHITGKIASGTLKAGVGCFRVPGFGAAGSRMADPGQVYQNPSPAAAASATAILASGGASSASPQTITSFNGATGANEMFPARQVTLVLSSHANWDATNATLTYYNQDGVLTSETLAIPDAGNATVTSVGYVKQVVSLAIPAQSGASGTFTMGVAILDSSVTIADYLGVVVYTPMVVPASTSASDAYEYADESVVDVMQKGCIWVACEGSAPAEGADVYVRVGAGSGGSQLGAFRTDSDTSTAVQIVGAKFGKTTDGLTKLELF